LQVEAEKRSDIASGKVVKDAPLFDEFVEGFWYVGCDKEGFYAQAL